jgi:hypothetical protein
MRFSATSIISAFQARRIGERERQLTLLDLRIRRVPAPELVAIKGEDRPHFIVY